MLRFVWLLPSVWLVACAEGNAPSPFSKTAVQRADAGEQSDDERETDDAPEADDAGQGGAPSQDDDTAGTGGSAENPSPPSCHPSDPTAFPPPLPTPRISLGKPVVASAGVENPEGLVDGDYHDSSTIVRLGTPSPDAPSWVAIDLGEGPTRVLAVWHDASYNVYNVPTGGSPAAYRVETSADFDGDDGTWTVAEEVEDNTVRDRAHAVPFAGQRWLRFTFTAAQGESSPINLDEIAVHDVSDVEDDAIDSWFFMGDSITQGAFKRDLDESEMFDERLAALQPDHFPAMINGGIGGELLSDALSRIDAVLSTYPHFRYVTVAFGTNDAWGNKSVAAAGFETRLVELVERILEAGRVPVLARIPFADAAHTTLPEFNEVIDRVQQEYELPCGPDLFGWFWEHPDGLGDDGVHPRQAGYAEINRLWAEAAAAYYGE